MMLTNPDHFDINQKKEFGLWPDLSLPAYGIIPYLNRLDRPDGLVGILVGVGRGENAYVMFSDLKKIKHFYGVDPYLPHKDIDVQKTREDVMAYKETAQRNLNGHFFPIIERPDNFNDDTYDFVMVDPGDKSTQNIETIMEGYYPKIKHGGYICGSFNNLLSVMEGLKNFRNKNKVRVPINHSTNYVWFWRKA